MIIISSNKELMQALEYFNGSLFLLCVKMSSRSASTSNMPPDNHQDIPKNEFQSRSSANLEQGGYFHPEVICDGCSGPIYGTHFKCSTCIDYDLCSGCENDIHVNHNMIGIGQCPNPNSRISFFGRPNRGHGSFYVGDRGRRGCGGEWHSKSFYYIGLSCRSGAGRWGVREGAGGWNRGHRAEGWGEGCGGRGRPGGGPYFPEQCRKPKDSQSKASGARPEPMDTEQKGGTSKEDHKGFFKRSG